MRLFDDDAPNYESASFPTPRPFQHEAHERLRQGFLAGHRCQMLMSATGSGKTFLGLRVIHEALKKGKRAIFVCDRRSLIEQTSAVADSYGLSAHGVMMANHNRFDPSMPFQIASAQTLARRKWPDADVIVIDEAHTQMKVWTEHIQNTNAAVIGLSATPFSTGLGKLFSNLVNATSMHHLTESGVLVPMRVFPCFKVDMRGAETSGGEWTDRAAQERGMAIVGDVVTEWSKFASDRKTIVFGATIAHCESMARQFNNSGIMAACFTSDTDQAERDMLLAEYRKPDSALRVLISVEALAKGFDVPDVSCVCDVRPLRKSLSTAIQMWGRGLRRSPDTGKTDCVLRDTMILTDKGEVRIQDITLDHKVWDGINFVDHCGIVCRGIRPVISYGGLTATPDHEVMTDDGWERFEDAARRKKRIIVAGIGGSPIRLSEDSLSKIEGSGGNLKVEVVCLRCSHCWMIFASNIWNRPKTQACPSCNGRNPVTVPKWLYERCQGWLQRCSNPRTPCFERYGARGIQFLFSGVNEAAHWVASTLGIQDRSMQLDRIDNNGHYEPGNIRWSHPVENMNNTRVSRGRKALIDFRRKHPEVMYADNTLHKLVLTLTEEEIVERWKMHSSKPKGKYGTFSMQGHYRGSLPTDC